MKAKKSEVKKCEFCKKKAAWRATNTSTFCNSKSEILLCEDCVHPFRSGMRHDLMIYSINLNIEF